MQKTIFIVDDDDMNLALVEEALEEQYTAITLSSAKKMFAILEKLRPDLILLDIEMPNMDGYEAMERLKANHSYADIPVIFLTGMTGSDHEAHGIELGAVDFITKPFSVPVLLNRIKNHLHIDDVIRERTELLRERTAQLLRLENSLVFTLADLVEARDKDTGGHIERTTTYMKIFLNAITERGIYSEEIIGWDLDSVISSARLHDVGKIAIPDSILNKPGRLTDEEFREMKTHAAAGEQIINRMIDETGEAELLRNAKYTATFHHERWDGTGYPYGLKGADIPLLGRLMAIIDVYDALTSARPYKKAFSSDSAVKIIMENSGSQFDPVLAEVFFDIQDRFEKARINLIRNEAYTSI